ncbi:hypothetical protein BD779DRAFT_1451314 [Infundibulicybe gibba]|nr:hypothetical protein BD779DRAFT_1451314 [Infundibulicybe gibba]
MPIPRFSNPHLLPGSSRQASRSEIFADRDSGSECTPELENENLVSQLHNLIRGSFNVENPPHRPKKRRKVEAHQLDSEPVGELICLPMIVMLSGLEFRLLSTSFPPLHISLEPKPPPPSITREPECEDSELQADLRHQRAKSAAIDASQIADRLGKRPSLRFKEMSYSTVVPMVRTPPLLVLECKQQPRRTRPPVPAHQLNHFPYNAKGTPYTTFGPIPACPIVEVTLTSLGQKPRRRQIISHGAPPPAFWKPDPSWRGKCLGYAYGYSNPHWDEFQR